MIWEVAKKELMANITSPKVVITYIVCTVLIFSALITGAVNYTTAKKETQTLRESEKNRLMHIYNFQQDYLTQGISLYREPSVLSTLVGGVEGDAARRSTMTNFTAPDFSVSRFNTTPILALFGMLDLEFIVKIILSLFAILFTFDAISGERELGTLKLNVAHGVKRSSLIFGKLVGGFFLLIIPFIIPLLLGLLVIQFFEGVVFTGEDWLRTVLIIASFIIYLTCFLTLGIMVSSLTKRSNISFLVLLMLWVLFIAVVPRGSVLISQSIYPVQSTEELRKEVLTAFGPKNYAANKRTFELITEFRTRHMAEITRRQPQKPKVDTPETKREYERQQREYQDYIQGLREQLMAEIVVIAEKTQDELRELGETKAHEYELAQDKQNDLSKTLSRYSSPAAALSTISNRIAKTGVYSSDKVFKDNIKKLVQRFVDTNRGILKENPEYIGFGQQQTEAIDISEYYPDIKNFRDETFGESFSAVVFDFGVLIILTVLFFAIAFVAFMRYEVR